MHVAEATGPVCGRRSPGLQTPRPAPTLQAQAFSPGPLTLTGFAATEMKNKNGSA